MWETFFHRQDRGEIFYSPIFIINENLKIMPMILQITVKPKSQANFIIIIKSALLLEYF